MKRSSLSWILAIALACSGPVLAGPPTGAGSLGNSPDDLGLDAETVLRREGIALDDSSLRAALADTEERVEVRYWAAVLLGRRADKGAAEALTAALASPITEVRLGAVLGMAELGGPEAAARLDAALGDPDAAVRGATVLALGRIGGRRAAVSLAAKLRDRDETSANVRMQAAVQLGRLGDPSALPALVRSLGDPQATVRAASAVSLASFGDTRALPALVAVALDPLSEEWQRVDALRALEELSGQRFGYVKPFYAPTTDQERQAALQHLRQWWRDHQRLGGKS